MDGVTEDAVAALRAAGDQLVAALRDQVADGQVETLYSLHTAAAALQRQAAEAEERIAAVTEAAVTAMRAVAEEHVAALKAQLAAQSRRDAAATVRMQKQVEALVERTDTTAGRTVELLQETLAQLSNPRRGRGLRRPATKPTQQDGDDR